MTTNVTPSPPPASPAPVQSIGRRDAIRFGLLGTAGFLLAGCQSGWKPLDRELGPLARPIPSFRRRNPSSASSALTPDPTLTQLPPSVIPRHTWTAADTIAARANPMVRVRRITVHHDGMPPVSLRSRRDVMRRLEIIRRSHVNARGWADIGYHFVVDPLGNVWEARPLIYQGAHVKDQNQRNMGIMLLGNFDEQSPTRRALAALDSFLIAQMTRFAVPVAEVVTHQELAPTACPGRSLQQHMVQTRSFSGVLTAVHA
ncbi:MAG: N-acetylmuramoyl-L-alanine amidase [Planctomycetes bacterium]|nr:N-acetylmuramoyl-L-alanine amidase [Planctomycetota bacterium]